MLWLAAITSSLSMYQPAVAHLKEMMAWTHAKATTVIAGIGTVGALLTLWFTAGGSFWNTVDFWVGTYLIFVLAMVQIIYFAWVFGIDRGWAELHSGASIQIPPFFKIIMKYVAPLYLIVVFVAFCRSNLGDWVKAVADDWRQQLAIGLILAVTAFLVVCTRIGEKRWKAAGLDLDGQRGLD